MLSACKLRGIDEHSHRVCFGEGTTGHGKTRALDGLDRALIQADVGRARNGNFLGRAIPLNLGGQLDGTGDGSGIEEPLTSLYDHGSRKR